MSGKAAGIGLVSLVAGVLLGGFGHAFLFAPDPATDRNDPDRAGGRTGARPDLVAENERLRSEIATLRSEKGRKQLDKPNEPKGEAKEAVIAEAAAKMGVQFDDPKFQEALASIDWNAVGASMRDMVPLIQKLADQLAKGEAPDLALAGEVQQLNGELLKAAQKIMAGKIPGSGINGAFTHPAVVANQFAAALKAAGLDLSDKQREEMDRVMKYYAAKDESLRLADHESKLQTLAEEAEFKNAFYEEARRLLSDEQRAALVPKDHQGRMGLDIFDSTLMLAQYARPLAVADAKELAASVAGQIASTTRLDADSRKQVQAIVSRWSNELPAEFWSKKAGALDRRGNLSGDRIRAALRRQQALTREILANVKLSPEARAALLENLSVLVPLPK